MPNTNSNHIKYISISTSIIAFILIVIVLKTLKSIFIPLLFSVFISFMFAPLNRLLAQKKVPVVLRVLTLGIILLALVSIIIILISVGINHFVIEFPKYTVKINELIVNIGSYLHFPDTTLKNLQETGFAITMFLDKVSINNILSKTMNNFMSIFTYSLLTIFFTIFIVSDDNHLIRKIINLSSKNPEFTEKITNKIEKQLILYILCKTLINLSSALVSGIFLYIIGVDFPILSGILIFIFGFIPEIGSVVAALFPIMFCLFKFGVSWQFITTIITLLVINSAFGNYIEPKFMGRQFNLSPILVLMALIFWAWVWGPVGMFIAVPLTSIINIVLLELNRFRNITDIISYKIQ